MKFDAGGGGVGFGFPKQLLVVQRVLAHLGVSLGLILARAGPVQDQAGFVALKPVLRGLLVSGAYE